jgi:hypothetical protein
MRLSTHDMIDVILSFQMIVAWAGEGLSEPPRLGWWRTDLIDEAGGGDLFRRLFPTTHRWAAFEALRKVAIRIDYAARQELSDPDMVRTLFFWGFMIDEKIEERLMLHKRSGSNLWEALPFFINLGGQFSRQNFEQAISIPNEATNFKVTPAGRELIGEVPSTLELQAQKLMAALVPLTQRYPMPFYRLDAPSEKASISELTKV